MSNGQNFDGIGKYTCMTAEQFKSSPTMLKWRQILVYQYFFLLTWIVWEDKIDNSLWDLQVLHSADYIDILPFPVLFLCILLE